MKSKFVSLFASFALAANMALASFSIDSVVNQAKSDPENAVVIIAAAVAQNPSHVGQIVAAAATAMPEKALDIVRAALEAAPEEFEAIVRASIKALPKLAPEIATVAVETLPGKSGEIIAAATEVAPAEIRAALASPGNGLGAFNAPGRARGATFDPAGRQPSVDVGRGSPPFPAQPIRPTPVSPSA